MTTESVAPPAQATQPDIPAVVRRLRETFATGRTRSIEWRKQQLRALERLMVDNEPAIAEALASGPRPQAVRGVAGRHRQHRHRSQRSRRRTSASGRKRKHRLLELSQLPGRGWVEYEPYGTVLIIGAWNFPFALTLGPAVGAIAAGNTVVLKPSEVAPASSALMAELVPKYLDNDAIAVIEGDGAVQPGTHRAGLRLPVVHRRHRDRPQGLRKRPRRT